MVAQLHYVPGLRHQIFSSENPQEFGALAYQTIDITVRRMVMPDHLSRLLTFCLDFRGITLEIEHRIDDRLARITEEEAIHRSAVLEFERILRDFMRMNPDGRMRKFFIDYQGRITWERLGRNVTEGYQNRFVLCHLRSDDWQRSEGIASLRFTNQQGWAILDTTENSMRGRTYTLQADHPIMPSGEEEIIAHNRLAMLIYHRIRTDFRGASARPNPRTLRYEMPVTQAFRDELNAINEERMAAAVQEISELTVRERDFADYTRMRPVLDRQIQVESGFRNFTLANDMPSFHTAMRWDALEQDGIVEFVMPEEEPVATLARPPQDLSVRAWPRHVGPHYRQLLEWQKKIKNNNFLVQNTIIAVNDRMREIWNDLKRNQFMVFFAPKVKPSRTRYEPVSNWADWLYFYHPENRVWKRFKVSNWSSIEDVPAEHQHMLQYFWEIEKKRPGGLAHRERLAKFVLERFYDLYWEERCKPLFEVDRIRVEGPTPREQLYYRPKHVAEMKRALQAPVFDESKWTAAGFRVKLDKDVGQLTLVYKTDGFKFENRFVIQAQVWVRLRFKLQGKSYIGGDAKANVKRVHPNISGREAGEWGSFCAGSFAKEFAIHVFDENDPQGLADAIVRHLSTYGNENPYHKVCSCGWKAWDLQTSAFVNPSYVCAKLRGMSRNHCNHDDADYYVPAVEEPTE